MKPYTTSYRLTDFTSGPIGNFIGIYPSLDAAESEIEATFTDKRKSEYEGQHLAHYQITEFTGDWEEGEILQDFYYYE